MFADLCNFALVLVHYSYVHELPRTDVVIELLWNVLLGFESGVLGSCFLQLCLLDHNNQSMAESSSFLLQADRLYHRLIIRGRGEDATWSCQMLVVYSLPRWSPSFAFIVAQVAASTPRRNSSATR